MFVRSFVFILLFIRKCDDGLLLCAQKDFVQNFMLSVCRIKREDSVEKIFFGQIQYIYTENRIVCERVNRKYQKKNLQKSRAFTPTLD